VEGLKPFRIYLFGSRAEGRARPESDFDLVVVFDDDASNSEADYDEVFAPVLDLPIAATSSLAAGPTSRRCSGGLLQSLALATHRGAVRPSADGR